jgi:hypothetical protein
MVLSYSFERRETVGFVKGTPTSDIQACIRDLPACAAQAHPLLLPTLLLSYCLSPKTENNHRTTRERLRGIEHALGRSPPLDTEYIDDSGSLKLRELNHAITESYARAQFQLPAIYLQVIGRLEAAANSFWDHLGLDAKTVDSRRLHAGILDRLEFHRAKLEGIETFASVTMRRLELQRGAVSSNNSPYLLQFAP